METKTLAFTLAIGIGVMLATSSVASVLAQNATAPGNSTIAAAKNATAGAAGAAKNATSNATSSSNLLAKIGKAFSKLFGAK